MFDPLLTFLQKNYIAILFGGIIGFIIGCIYKIFIFNEHFTSTMPGGTDPTTTIASGITGPTNTSGITGPTTTPGMTGPTTTPGITGPTTTTTGSSGTTVPQTTQMNRALDANSYKLSTTNLYQKKFEGASNVYSPYIYVKEPYGVSNDMDNFTHL